MKPCYRSWGYLPGPSVRLPGACWGAGPSGKGSPFGPSSLGGDAWWWELGQVKGSTGGCAPALGPSSRSEEGLLQEPGQVPWPCTWLWLLHWGCVKPRCGGLGLGRESRERQSPTLGPGYRGEASLWPTKSCLLQKLLQLILQKAEHN